MPRKDLGAIVGRAVHGGGGLSAGRAVADQPADVVGEVLGPHLGQIQRIVAFALVALPAARDRDRPVRLGCRRRQVERHHSIVWGQICCLDIAPVLGEQAVRRRTPQFHPVVEPQSLHRVLAGDHERFGGCERHGTCRSIGARGVVRPDSELLAGVRPGEQFVEPDQALVGVDECIAGEARVTGRDPAVLGDGVPAVDRGVELEAGIGTLPRRFGHLPPQITGADGLEHLAGGDRGEVPVGVVDDGLHELVGDPHRVVGVLVLDRERVGAVEVHVETGVTQDPRLALLDRLAPDELLDVGMVGVEDHHLRRPPGLAARLDRARRRIGTAHEAHRPGRRSAAVQEFLRRSDAREIDAGARPALEDDPLLAVPVEDRVHRRRRRRG